MPNRRVYDATNISMEGEWYFISIGIAGSRMDDDTEIDYSSYLNNWTGLVDSFSE
jgi:hypothetical protein